MLVLNSFDFLSLASQLAASACTSLDVQLSFGQDPDHFVETYARYAGSGYVQLPFLKETRSPRNSAFVWTQVRRGSRILGQLGGVIVPGDPRAPHSLADSLASGLLYQPGGTWLEHTGWIPGAGEGILEDAPSLYFGGGWVGSELRGLGLVGVMSRLTALQAFCKEPALSSVWGLEEEGLLLKGVMARDSGLGIVHSKKVFEGFSELAGKPLVLHAIWANRAEYLQLLEKDRQCLQLGGSPTWLGKSAAPR